MENVYLAKQLSDPIARALDSCAIANMGVSDVELAYMAALSIDTAEADMLGVIGRIVGLPWPTAPEGTFDTNRFTFGSSATFPTINLNKGFGGIGLLIGGGLGTVSETTSVVMPIGNYRTLLKLVARAKTYGFSLTVFDDLVDLFVDTGYVITWNANHDVVCTFTPVIDAGPLFIIQKIIDLFAISPKIILVQTP